MIRKINEHFKKVIEFYSEDQAKIEEFVKTMKEALLGFLERINNVDELKLTYYVPVTDEHWDTLNTFLQFDEFKQARISDMIIDQFPNMNIKIDIFKDTHVFIGVPIDEDRIIGVSFIWDYDFKTCYDPEGDIFQRINCKRSVKDIAAYEKKQLASYIDNILLYTMNNFIAGESKVVIIYDFEQQKNYEDFYYLRLNHKDYYNQILKKYDIELNEVNAVNSKVTFEIMWKF